MDIVIVEDDQIFNDTINKYIELKHQKKSIDEELDKCLEEFQEYAGIDLKSDFEGVVNLIFGITKVQLEFKFNRSINEKLLSDLCKKTGKPAQTYAKVKFECPTKTMMSNMDTKTINAINSIMTKKRAKTSVKIDID